MSDNLLLCATGLRKEFRTGRQSHNVIALDDVSFSVEYGGSLALVGESGAGKSTAARIVVGLESATSGTVELAGRPMKPRRHSLKARRARARIVQMVFQDPYGSLDPSQTIRDALREVLSLHGDVFHGKQADRIAQLGEQVGLDERQLASYPGRLSGGQQQRAAIARALAVRPSLIVLDEAVSALDVSIQAQILNLLNEIRQEENIAYLLISHDLAVVRQLCDFIVVMKNGQVVERGSTEHILDESQHPYTRHLRDCVPQEGWNPERALAAGLDT